MPHQRAHGLFAPAVVRKGLLLSAALCLVACQGAAKSMSLHPSPATLAPEVPMTFEVRVVPHQNPNHITTYDVSIDEDDNIDDGLQAVVKATFDPNDPARNTYALGTFTLRCTDLNETTGEFDLVGANKTSFNEVTHLVHAEGPAPATQNIEVKCAIPSIPAQDETSAEAREEGSTYCLYKLDRVEPSTHPSVMYNGNKVCVRCVSGETQCPTKAVLDRGEGEKWHLIREEETCTQCPTGVGVAPPQKRRQQLP